jgi:fluoroacetyl-CoA thioesterase
MREIPEGYEETVGVVVTDEMTVNFGELGRVHPVYATYWLAKHMEEAGRKVIVPFLQEDEEGIGRAVSVTHLASALPGMRIEVTARHVSTVTNAEGRFKIQSECTAYSELGDLIGTGSTEQYVFPATTVESNFAKLEERWGRFVEAKRQRRPDLM